MFCNKYPAFRPISAITLLAVAFFSPLNLSAQVAQPPSIDAHHRPFKIDDIFDTEDIGFTVTFSPDGQAMTFERVRPSKQWKDFAMTRFERSDVWLQEHPKDIPVKLTNGEEDDSGWFAPQWSPDGRYLAMFSTRGGNLTLWVYDLAKKRLRQLTSRGIDGEYALLTPFLWVDSHDLLTEVFPPGEKPTILKAENETQDVAPGYWIKQRAGKEVTASVLESGIPVKAADRPQSQLERIDVENGSATVIADENTSARQLSPDGRFLAFAKPLTIYTPKADEALAYGLTYQNTFTFEITSTTGERVISGEQYSHDIFPDSMRWSPDGKQLAFLGYPGARENTPHLYKVNVGSGKVEEQDLGEVDAAPLSEQFAKIEWTKNGEILLQAAKRNHGRTPGVEDRRDWWLIGSDGTANNLTATAKKAPATLWASVGRDTFFGLADGKLVRITPASVKLESISVSINAPITRVVWPYVRDTGYHGRVYVHPSEYDEIVVATGEGKETAFDLVNVNSGSVQPMQKPSPAATFMAFDPVSRSAAFSSSDNTGTFLWRTSPDNSAPTELLSLNTFFSDIVTGKPQQIEYTSLNGEKLKGWIILPYGYQPGHKYPTITWVYAGDMARSTPPQYGDLSFSSSLNLQIPAAHGYAVLVPSIPLKPIGETEDPLLQLTNGVIPAVDKGIELGIVDPERIYVMGQSYGGFTTYGLVTQTNRFKAAVSLAGLADFISMYGQFDARFRYESHPEEDLWHNTLFESGQSQMGSAPWKDLGRYIRNSPISYVERVQTPLLIIQGDMDAVPMQQGEEFFSALYRQGKRAKFIRYWGEGHIIESPANIHDMWNQIFSWFDEFGGSQNGAADVQSKSN